MADTSFGLVFSPDFTCWSLQAVWEIKKELGLESQADLGWHFKVCAFLQALGVQASYSTTLSVFLYSVIILIISFKCV